MTNYENFAYVYDALMWDFDYGKVYDFIRQFKGAGKCLEMGCGTGSLTSYLIEAFEVTAFDLSEDMLAVADAKGLKHVTYFKQDLRSLALDGTYDLMVSSCDTLNYLKADEDLQKVFHYAATHLSEDGVFIFDMNAPFKFEDMNDTYVDETDGVFYVWENFYDRDSHFNTYSVNFFKEENDGSYTRFYEEHEQRAYSVEEIVTALAQAGLEADVYDDYTLAPLKPTTERLTVVARRKYDR
ncbi:class I SAM-dependent methyltransferase [Peptoniphilus equinus]|uniref:Class I SAM-dependent methyltransferase n=1 Tax=Peptoniphilus equinus TaxID=3016343 RepID=A0ABY7QT05_9FIRM|nr:class I SAM-dependent methyltransferase [Peptoniphilus equinus]WBW49601.1 class I SAM-dependent methyltransferase [Peptoniphilus equinus]